MTPEQEQATAPRYLGDGVYVSFDGWQLWVAANSHTRPQRVALEPAVLLRLLNYARGINAAFATEHFPVDVVGAV